MNVVLAGTLALFLTGCREPQQPPSSSDTTLVVSSDPELRAAVADLLPALAERSGLELRAPVRVERRSREELERYLRVKLDEELDPVEEDLTRRSYALLGLMPRDLDLRGLLLNVYTEQVAGFYDPDSTALFVMDDQPTETLTTLLVHELVHAVQDQATDLDSLTARERGNDRRSAAQAAIEGHATLVMLEFMMERLQGRALDLSHVPDFAAQLRPALETVRAQYPALGSAPRIVQETMLFPYLEGAGFVQALWRARGGRPAPFGENLPQSTEQVIYPDRLLGPLPDPPTSVTVSADGGRTVHRSTLGELETKILLEELGGADAGSAAEGWDGDGLVLLEVPGGTDALAWAAVWDDTAARDRFLATVRRDLPDGWSVEGREVDGRAVSVLTVGAAGSLTIALDGG